MHLERDGSTSMKLDCLRQLQHTTPLSSPAIRFPANPRAQPRRRWHCGPCGPCGPTRRSWTLARRDRTRILWRGADPQIPGVLRDQGLFGAFGYKGHIHRALQTATTKKGGVSCKSILGGMQCSASIQCQTHSHFPTLVWKGFGAHSQGLSPS